MSKALFPAPAAGFDAPLDMLRACHDRMLRQLDTLMRLADHLGQHGLDEAARTAAKQVHHYFSTAAQHHHQDEEHDLFPQIVRDSELAKLLTRLQADHEEMLQSWEALAPLLADPTRITDLHAFAQTAARFRRLYEQHIALENAELLPKAKDLLDATQLRELGARMAQRRGVKLE